METRWLVEFTGVELPAPVEKAMIGLVEKAVTEPTNYTKLSKKVTRRSR
jgi:hypothetical protein